MRLFSPFFLRTVKIGEDCTGFLLLKKNFFAVNFPNQPSLSSPRGFTAVLGCVFCQFYAHKRAKVRQSEHSYS